VCLGARGGVCVFLWGGIILKIDRGRKGEEEKVMVVTVAFGSLMGNGGSIFVGGRGGGGYTSVYPLGASVVICRLYDTRVVGNVLVYRWAPQVPGCLD